MPRRLLRRLPPLSLQGRAVRNAEEALDLLRAHSADVTEAQRALDRMPSREALGEALGENLARHADAGMTEST